MCRWKFCCKDFWFVLFDFFIQLEQSEMKSCQRNVDIFFKECSNIQAHLSVHWWAQCHTRWPSGYRVQHPPRFEPILPSKLQLDSTTKPLVHIESKLKTVYGSSKLANLTWTTCGLDWALGLTPPSAPKQRNLDAHIKILNSFGAGEQLASFAGILAHGQSLSPGS